MEVGRLFCESLGRYPRPSATAAPRGARKHAWEPHAERGANRGVQEQPTDTLPLALEALAFALRLPPALSLSRDQDPLTNLFVSEGGLPAQGKREGRDLKELGELAKSGGGILAKLVRP